MIQPASDPHPGRSVWRPGPAARPQPQAPRRVPAHAWPFLSRPVPGGVAQATSTLPRNDSGS